MYKLLLPISKILYLQIIPLRVERKALALGEEERRKQA
jgi:hypothetical protein